MQQVYDAPRYSLHIFGVYAWELRYAKKLRTLDLFRWLSGESTQLRTRAAVCRFGSPSFLSSALVRSACLDLQRVKEAIGSHTGLCVHWMPLVNSADSALCTIMIQIAKCSRLGLLWMTNSRLISRLDYWGHCPVLRRFLEPHCVLTLFDSAKALSRQDHPCFPPRKESTTSTS